MIVYACSTIVQPHTQDFNFKDTAWFNLANMEVVGIPISNGQ